MVLRYQKPICLIVLISLYWLCIPQLPAKAAMVTTEDTLNRGSNSDFDRARIKAFVSRKDVIAQLKSYGISYEEASARVDSLTDQEIALIIGKIEKLPAGGDAGTAFGNALASSISRGINAFAGTVALYALIAALVIAIIIAIIAYALDEGPNKPTYREF
jgi:hypothetical protein